jgi:ribose transport system substrate-binding protein
MVDTTAFKKASPWTVGRAGAGDVNDWMVMLTNHYDYSIKEKYKNLFKDYFVTAANFDPAKQISDVEDLLSKNIQLLFIEPAAEAPLTAIVDKAMKQGVPVVLASTRVNTPNYAAFVFRNNVQVGYMYADYIGKKLNGKGNVVLLMGFAGSSYAEDVLRGVRQGLAAYPDIKEVGMANANWSPTDGKKAMEAFIQANPQIDGVISDGGQMGLGAVDALVDAKRPLVPITSDGWNSWLARAKELAVPFFSVSGDAALSMTAVDQAVKILKGEPIVKNIEYPVVTFQENEVDKYYRPDLNGHYWGPNELPEEWVKKLYAK